MVTVKKDTIRTKVFEKKIIKTIKTIKGMDLPEKQKDDILYLMRELHISCMEWGKPEDAFKIVEELR